MKRKSCEYDYVEVMACPSGCLNGGGQLKAGQGQSQQQLLDQLDAIYHDPEVHFMSVLNDPDVPHLGCIESVAGSWSARCYRHQPHGANVFYRALFRICIALRPGTAPSHSLMVTLNSF